MLAIVAAQQNNTKRDNKRETDRSIFEMKKQHKMKRMAKRTNELTKAQKKKLSIR